MEWNGRRDGLRPITAQPQFNWDEFHFTPLHFVSFIPFNWLFAAPAQSPLGLLLTGAHFFFSAVFSFVSFHYHSIPQRKKSSSRKKNGTAPSHCSPREMKPLNSSGLLVFSFGWLPAAPQPITHPKSSQLAHFCFAHSFSWAAPRRSNSTFQSTLPFSKRELNERVELAAGPR